MKAAAARDNRRRVLKRGKSSSPLIKSIKISNLIGFEDISVTPESSVVVICGSTGVGKTALLNVINLALQPSQAANAFQAPLRLGNFSTTIEIDALDKKYIRTLNVGTNTETTGDPYEPEAVLVTLYDRTDDLLATFESYSQASVIEGYEPKIFSREQLSLVSRAVGKTYSNIAVYEVEDYDNDDKYLPYFIATDGAVTYDLHDMGTGELSAIYLTWIIDYVKVGSIVLVEEPEAMLPPSSHLGIYDILCKGAMTKQCCLIISTHSSELVAEIPLENLLPLTRINNITKISSRIEDKHRLLESLGLKIRKTTVIFVEDELAYHIASELIARFDLSLYRHVEIKNMGTGFGTIKEILSIFPILNCFNIIGLLDGDMKSKISSWQHSNKYCFLPFEKSMEEEFLDCIAKVPDTFGKFVRRTQEDVEHALSSGEGSEAHDRFSILIDRLGITVEQAAIQCFNLWLEPADRVTISRNSVASIRRLTKF